MVNEAQGKDGVFDVTESWDTDGRPPSMAIIESIAAIEGTNPTRLDFNLSDFVDPEALDRLFLAQTFGNIAVEFDLDKYLVTVRTDGSLRIQDHGGD